MWKTLLCTWSHGGDRWKIMPNRGKNRYISLNAGKTNLGVVKIVEMDGSDPKLVIETPLDFDMKEVILEVDSKIESDSEEEDTI